MLGDDDKLAIEHQPLFLQGPKGRQNLREVTRHRPGAPADQLDLVPIAEDQVPETIPLWLVLPAVALRDAIGRGRREHGLHVQLDRQLHGLSPAVYILWMAHGCATISMAGKVGHLNST